MVPSFVQPAGAANDGVMPLPETLWVTVIVHRTRGNGPGRITLPGRVNGWLRYVWSFMARSAKASFKAFIKAYERRPVVEITPTMVTAGMDVLRTGLQDTAKRVFHAMMRDQPPLEVTPRMEQTAAELMFIRVDFDADRLAAEILLVMFLEGRLDPAWASRHAQERAVPRSIEMLSMSEGQIITREDGMVLVLPAKPPMAAGLPYVGPQYLCISREAVASGRDALYAGWKATTEKVFHAALADKGIDVTAAMKEAGLNAMTGGEGLAHDSIVALILGDMLDESGHRGEFTRDRS